MANKDERFSFAELPTGLGELQALEEATLDSPFKTTALVMVALCQMEKDENATFEILDFLKGPDSVSMFEKQFIKERLNGKYYKIFSFFEGATPENGYKPTKPYTIKVTETPYSYPQDNYATMYVTSSGADSPRAIRLRKKPSTGQWFLVEIQCLSDIRVPVEEDPWA